MTPCVTPEKGNKKGKKQITLFVISTGKQIIIRLPSTAEKYALENGDAIVATHTFPTLAACQKFQNQFTQTPKIESNTKHTHMSSKEQAAIERINH